MDQIPLRFIDDVIRFLDPFDAFPALSELKSAFGAAAERWSKRWFRCYLALIYDQKSGNFEYCHFKSTSANSEVPTDLSVLESCILDPAAVNYVHEYVVRIFSRRPEEKINWISAPAGDSTLRRHLNALHKAPTASLVLGFQGAIDINKFLKILPSNFHFHEIFADDFYHPSLDSLIQGSMEARRLRRVSCEDYMDKLDLNALVALFRDDQFEEIRWPLDSDERPLARTLTQMWIAGEFNSYKGVYSKNPPVGLDCFPFKRMNGLPEEKILEQTVYTMYTPEEQLFFELEHPSRDGKKALLHLLARDVDCRRVESIKQASEVCTSFDLMFL